MNAFSCAFAPLHPIIAVTKFLFRVSGGVRIPAQHAAAMKPKLRLKLSMSNNSNFGLTPAELRKIRAMKTPCGVQRFIDSLPYHLEDTSWSPRKVLREGTAHCLEGAIFGAAALRVLGFPPLLWDLEADYDTDHVLAIFKVRGHWGAVAKSNWAGCRYREPIHRSLRELALTYFNLYCNFRKERTMRRYSRPVNLKRFDHLNWMTAEKDPWFIAEYLCEIPHIPLLKSPMVKRLCRVDDRLFRAELTDHRWK
jgi:hypothetical protein